MDSDATKQDLCRSNGIGDGDLVVDLSRSRLPPYAHQRLGVEKLVEHPHFFITDEMGAGKTKQVIDAAQVLAMADVINHVVVIAPAAVRGVWYDPELGELAKHLWKDFPAVVVEFHAKLRTWSWNAMEPGGRKIQPKLRWTITNYDFIRNKARLKEFVKYCDKKTLLVLDESSAVKSWRALQTKACEEIRSYCGRVVLLNGTPIANNPGDLYSQAHIMDPKILNCKTFFHFRSRYGVMGGWQGKVVVNWKDIPDLQARLAPFVLRRLKEHCIDLPLKIDAVPMFVPLDPATWRIYKEMKDEMVASLQGGAITSAAQAVVKAIRLAQITSGFVGGVELLDLTPEGEPKPDWLSDDFGPDTLSILHGKEAVIREDQAKQFETNPIFNIPLQEVGREKLDFFLKWLDEQLGVDPNLKLLVWARFRPEVARLFQELTEKSKLPVNMTPSVWEKNSPYAKLTLGKIWGGQKRAEREDAIRLLDPRTTPSGPSVVIGTPASGSMGLNLTAAHTVVYLSNDFSLKTRLQSEDRVHRPGQVHNVSYFDVIATGPAGQKTIDHSVVKALRAKEDLADMTTSAWLDVLAE